LVVVETGTCRFSGIRIVSISAVSVTLSPTITPPVSRTKFQVRPKSLRLIGPGDGERDALVAEMVDDHLAARDVEEDTARDTADREVAGDS